MKFIKGDKVRMLRSSEEGHVVKISGDIIEIETTDGFNLPVLASELVKVAAAEEQYFHKSEPLASKPVVSKNVKTRANRLCFGLEVVNDTLLRPFIINDSDLELLFVLSKKEKGIYKNTFAGSVSEYAEIRVGDNLDKTKFDEWSKWQIQLLSFKSGASFELPKAAAFQLKASKIFAEKEIFPNSNRTGYVMEIALNEISEDLSSLEEVATEKKDFLLGKAESIIDLHKEALQISSVNSDEILAQQLGHFLKELDKAIVADVMELTVIHGVGNGVLKENIHKYLSRNEHVEWYKEANKEKFGFGATKIRFKA